MLKELKEIQDTEKLKRNNNVQILFNDLEMEALNKYFKKYKVSNRSKFIRETVIKSVLQKFEEDYPSLFEAEEEKTGKLF